jgi:iron complex outermembrane receptor protein
MKRTLLFAATFLLAAIMTTFAQTTGTLAGKVARNDGKPIIGAAIRILGTTQGGISKAPDGRFMVRGIRPGDYDLVVSAIGLRNETRTVRISAGDTMVVNVQLPDGPVHSYPCFVSRLINPEKTGTITTVTAEQLERMP